MYKGDCQIKLSIGAGKKLEQNCCMKKLLCKINFGMWYKIILFLQLYLFSLAPSIFANYGESCAPLPMVTTDNYLVEGTAYGYLRDNIDIKTYAKGCDEDSTQLKFCLKDPNRSNPNCTNIVIQNGETKTLLALDPKNPLFGSVKQLQDIALTVTQLGSSLCLTMPTSRGRTPLICKNLSNTNTGVEPEERLCSNIGDSCYMGKAKSQSWFNFSGQAIHCVKETLDKVFFDPNKCTDNKINFDSLNPFYVFQESLKVAIRAAFIIYVTIYGFKVVTSNEYLQLEKLSMFALKLILVAYFSVGIGPVYFSKDRQQTAENGMLTQGLPLLLQIASNFTHIVFTAGGAKGLCEFDLSKYERGYDFYAVWDAVDCRIGHYLGISIMNNTFTLLKSTGSGASKAIGRAIDIPNFGNSYIKDLAVDTINFKFFVVLFGFLMAGNILIVLSGVAFSVIFISVNLYFVTSYLVSIITIYVMTYISPIFIPMALFDRTKSYFDSWLRISISCALQPAIIAGFIALLLSMYDTAIYNNCQFQRHDYEILGSKFSTFELREPELNAAQCRDSLGYKLLRVYAGEGWEEFKAMFFVFYAIIDLGEMLYKFLHIFVFSLIFYFFSQYISQFAAEITNGPNMGAVAASPAKVVDLVREAAKFIKDAAQKASGDASPKKEDDKGKSRKGGEGGGDKAEDKISGGSGGGADDKINTGNK
jgi:type IV secretion system protein VirB6